jgi:predicted PurR-regulated permease PerM
MGPGERSLDSNNNYLKNQLMMRFLIVSFILISLSFPVFSQGTQSTLDKISICNGATYEQRLILKNEEDLPVLYSVSVDEQSGSFVAISQPEVFVAARSTEYVTVFITPPRDFNGEIRYTIKTNDGRSSRMLQQVEAQKCYNIEVDPVVYSVGQCPCRPAMFTFDVRNTQGFTDTISLDVDAPEGYVSGLDETMILLGGEEKEISFFMTLPCDIYGEFSYDFIVESGRSDYKLTVPFSLFIDRDCYSFDLDLAVEYVLIPNTTVEIDPEPKDELSYDLCLGRNYYIPIIVSNPTDYENAYVISSQEYDWFSFSNTSFRIAPQEEFITGGFVYAEDPGRLMKTTLPVSIEGYLGGIEQSEILNISFQDCGLVNLSLEQEEAGSGSALMQWLLVLVVLAFIVLIVLLIVLLTKKSGKQAKIIFFDEDKKREDRKEKKKDEELYDRTFEEKKAPFEKRLAAVVLLVILVLLIIIGFALISPFIIENLSLPKVNISIGEGFFNISNQTNMTANMTNQTMNITPENMTEPNITLPPDNQTNITEPSNMTNQTDEPGPGAFEFISQNFFWLIILPLIILVALVLIVVLVVIILSVARRMPKKSKELEIVSKEQEKKAKELQEIKKQLKKEVAKQKSIRKKAVDKPKESRNNQIFLFVLLAFAIIAFIVLFAYTSIHKPFGFVVTQQPGVDSELNATIQRILGNISLQEDTETIKIIDQGSQKTFNIAGMVSDPDSDELTFRHTPVNNISIQIDEFGEVTVTPDPGWTGITTASFIADDGKGGVSYSPDFFFIVKEKQEQALWQSFLVWLVVNLNLLIVLITALIVIIIIAFILKTQKPRDRKRILLVKKKKTRRR